MYKQNTRPSTQSIQILVQHATEHLEPGYIVNTASPQYLYF